MGSPIPKPFMSWPTERSTPPAPALQQHLGLCCGTLRRLRVSEDGFSLVEVIVAMMILTIGVLSMAAAVGYLTMQVRLADRARTMVPHLSDARTAVADPSP
jgi:prepilin-type N-terminal cleavage/methylation domain-containing protein